MLKGNAKYCLLLILAVSQVIYLQAQLGQPIINIHFGSTDPLSTVASPPPDLGTTDFIYTDSLCPPQGSYTIFRKAANGCYNDSWIPLYSDHTEGLDLGNMMLVNSFDHAGDKVLFTDTITGGLCVGTSYVFSMAVINLSKPSTCNANFPIFTLRILDLNGVELADFRSAPLGYASDFMGYKFGVFSLRYLMPAGVNGLILQAKAGLARNADNECGSDFAVDDIMFAPAGPKITVDFDPPYKDNFITSVCYQHNKTISVSGQAAPFYNNIAYQWQQSTDSGSTWQNITGETNSSYTNVYSIPDTFWVRLKAAEASDISNPGCGVVSDILRIHSEGLPTNFDATSNSPVCAGSNNDLKFDASGGATYEWTGPNGFYDNIQFPHIYSPGLRDSGWYYLTITTLGGCKARDSVFARVIGTDVQTGSDTAICIGGSAVLSVNNGATYSWSPSAGLSAIDVQHPVAAPLVSTLYTVNHTSNDGCSDTAQVWVEVKNKEAVKASFVTSDYVCMPVDSLFFKYTGTGPVTSWQWDFNNGSTASGEAPSVQYYYSPYNSSYRVRLTVSDSLGCSDEFYKQIRVADMCNMEFPKAFTPNGDGLNDYFWPLNAYKAEQIVFTVFNRKGIKVFETEQWPGKWDGTYKGEPQDPGTYVWLFQYTDAMGNKQIQKGTVVLLR